MKTETINLELTAFEAHLLDQMLEGASDQINETPLTGSQRAEIQTFLDAVAGIRDKIAEAGIPA